MQHEKHLNELLANFPWQQYPTIQPNQMSAMEFIAKLMPQDRFVAILEGPTGVGKTVIAHTFLKTLEQRGEGPLFFITPTKALVDQVKRLHPDVTVAYGRHEFPCSYEDYENEDPRPRADEIPCASLIDCPHRVDQKTGETKEPGASPCQYYLQKYQAKQANEARRAKIVVCTDAFHLFNQLFTQEWEEPAGLVIDEVHRIAQVVRNGLSYEITDWYLRRAVELLVEIDAPAGNQLNRFLQIMIGILKHKPAYRETLLHDHEIRELMDCLMELKEQDEELKKNLVRALKSGKFDSQEHRKVIKQLETVLFDLRRYWRSFEYSLSTPERHALNYTFGCFKKELVGNERAQYRLVIKGYHVAPLIRKRLLGKRTLCMSATIGDPLIFNYEAGIKGEFQSLKSDFPVGNSRVFLPKDTPNLAVRERGEGQPAKVLRRIAKACNSLARVGLRSLMVVVSENERQKFLELCQEESVDAISYGNGATAKEAAANFKDGAGEVLVGTVANYGEGIDLPRQMAPVIFFLRPGYPDQNAPSSVFEERRWGSKRWMLWNWRVMIEALQVRGRNIRSAKDLGVTVFISQQFRRFLKKSLPGYLQEAYQDGKSLDECLREAKRLLTS